MKAEIRYPARRVILRGLGGFVVGAGIAAPGDSWIVGQARAIWNAPDEKSPAPDVGPLEDLMREHGALSRFLLIYDEIVSRLEGKREFPVEALEESTMLIRRFVEDYHEKLEEQHIFPRFKKAGKLVDLVDILLAQHQAGRRLTDSILKMSKTPGQAAARVGALTDKLADALRRFTRMYRPHKAREDTVLFPAFHSLVTAAEFDKLGDEFEDKENELFGKEGFESIVAGVAKLEQRVGIYELSGFTPKMSS